MGLVDFFKEQLEYIRAKGRINTQIKPYIKSSMGKSTHFRIIENPSDDITEAVESLAKKVKYNDLVKRYNTTISEIKEHNEYIYELTNEIAKFNYNEYINNITEYNLDDIKEKHNDLYDKIKKFNCYNEVGSTFINQYEAVTCDFDLIVKQYNIRNEYNSFLNKIYNHYIDYYESMEIKAKLDEYEGYFKHKQYYKVFFINYLDYVEGKNRDFVNLHKSSDILDDVNGRCLDNEQREAVVRDEIANLVVAGAGSGKTLTICGKVKYLIEECNIDKNDILLLSYSKKSADDLNNKISAMYDDMNVSTFHALGLKIITYLNGKKYAIEEQYKAIIEKYFREDLYKREGMAYKVFSYIALYSHQSHTEKTYKDKGEFYEDLAHNDFKTLKNLLNSSEEPGKRVTLKKELVKSYEELAIANFYFINGIKYEYERPFKMNTATSIKRQYTPDFYLTDYDIYHEHYGINSKNKCPQFNPDDEAEYLRSMEWKRELHRNLKTNYIESYSYQFKENNVLDILTKALEAKGVVFNRISDEDIAKAMNSIYKDVSFKSFINLVTTFINLYKSRYDSNEYFKELRKKLAFNPYDKARCKLLLDICKDIYDYYMDYLANEDKIDFDDMILKSINGLDSLPGFKYKYIIVDEFQDISNSRMRFILKLLEHGHGKLFAVGDDYQAIYRFTGCDLNYFVGFDSYFKKTSKSFITSTHRNSQELQDVVVPFILKNPIQLKKKIKSEKHLDMPVRIMYADKSSKGETLADVIDIIHNENPNASIMLLGRNNMDLIKYKSNRLNINEKTLKIKSNRYPDLKLTYSTVHGSKGLEDDYVILINADNGTYGFPNQMEDDPILDLLLNKESGIPLSEERRLWYVALTRTKSCTYIIADINNPSIFLDEIKDKCLVLNNDNIYVDRNPILCPNCKSGRLKLKTRSNGKQYYCCSNYPYCKYTNGNIEAVRANRRCPYCGNFITIRQGPTGYFWGCCGYPKCRFRSPYRG